MHLRCDGIFNAYFITRLLLHPTVRKWWKSINIRQSYEQE